MALTDKHTIENIGIPSLVLMERAALKCVEKVESIIQSHEILNIDSPIEVLCGPGNNGGDGIAIARMLHLKGFNARYLVLGNEEKYSEQLTEEIKIASNYGVNRVCSLSDLIKGSSSKQSEQENSSKLLIDAIFGIGLSRNISGEYKDAIEYMNKSNAVVLSVDIPSGYNSDTGEVMGIGVRADHTITFAYAKKGLLLSDCYINKGDLTIADVGIYTPIANDDYFADMCYILENSDISQYIPATKTSDNKGSRGKVLVIAGSENIYGACYLSAKAALSCGTGLVKIYTHKNNISSIQTSLPEAMYDYYTNFDDKKIAKLLADAKCILIGPGLGTSESALKTLKYVLSSANVPIVIDADGINLLANNARLLTCAKSPIVLTPHLKEMSRLVNASVKDISTNMEQYATEFCNQYNVSMILKNFTSFILTPYGKFINTTGNEGMATAGSGDVLAGILASLLGQGISMDLAPALASYIHGKAGEKASVEKGKRQMIASDIIDNIEL